MRTNPAFLVLSLLLAAGCGPHDAAPACDGGACTDGGAPSDPLAQARLACTFTTGAKVADTLGFTAADRARVPLTHIVILMKENRSFDHLFGRLHDQGQPAVEAIPSDFTNAGLQKEIVAPHRADTTCIPHDPDHQWLGMHLQVNNDRMDGFVLSAAISTNTDGHFAMGYYEQEDLPFYHFLAGTYALSDRHFPSVRSGTFPNRDFLLLGTADGVSSTGSGYPRPDTPTLMDLLDAAHVTWGAYSDGALLSGTLNWKPGHANTGDLATFLRQLDDGTLPAVSFVDGIENVDDDHPTADMQQGESWLRAIYQRAVASPLWPKMALLWTYDEAGGFFDHVVPPGPACVARPVDRDQMFTELGVRVPLVAISPWARPHSVSHVAHDHTAITRFIEAVFDLPALTARDANSDALLDLFDFTQPALMTPPKAPLAGTGGCKGVKVSADKPNYKPGDPIKVSFTGGPGANPKDWIAIYEYGPSGPTPPKPGALNWVYIGGTQKPTTSPAMGAVQLDGTTMGKGAWPLPAGGYIAYYLLDDGYASLASIDFNVVN